MYVCLWTDREWWRCWMFSALKRRPRAGRGPPGPHRRRFTYPRTRRRRPTRKIRTNSHEITAIKCLETENVAAAVSLPQRNFSDWVLGLRPEAELRRWGRGHFALLLSHSPSPLEPVLSRTPLFSHLFIINWRKVR